MAAQSYWSGKKQYWDPKTEQIVEQPVSTNVDVGFGVARRVKA
jgi:hypothetical protein